MPSIVRQRQQAKAARLKASVRKKFQPIPGSKLLRALCGRCGQKTRVTFKLAAKFLHEPQKSDIILCNECAPGPLCDRGVFLTKRQRAVLGKTRS
jgi:hypothetical protein